MKAVNVYPENVKVYKDKKGEWRWRITSSNNRVIGASTESYKNKGDCEDNLIMVAGSIVTGEAYMNYLKNQSQRFGNDNGTDRGERTT